MPRRSSVLDVSVSGTLPPTSCKFPGAGISHPITTTWGKFIQSRASGNPMAADGRVSSLAVDGVRIEMIERGRGRPLLFLHPGIGIAPDAAVLDRLAERMRVLAPSHP